MQDSRQNMQLSFIEAFPIGIKVLFGEIHWHILRGLRLLEIKQMKKRLENEYQKLGELSRENQNSQNQEIESQREICNKQIEFLEKEIDYLEKDLEKLRTDMISRRREKWNI